MGVRYRVPVSYTHLFPRDIRLPPAPAPAVSLGWSGGLAAVEKARITVSYTHLDVYKRQTTYNNKYKKAGSRLNFAPGFALFF